MASTYTSNLKIEKIGSGEQSGTWGTTTNLNIEAIESSICGRAVLESGDFSTNVATLSISDSNAAQDGRFFYLEINASLSGNATVNLPAIAKDYIVFNNNAGDYHVQAKVSGQTGVQIPKGEKAYIFVDGTDAKNGVTHSENFGVNMRTSGLANDAIGSNWALYAQSNDEAPAAGFFGFKFSGSDPSPAIAAYTNQTAGNNLISFFCNTAATATAVGSALATGSISTNGSTTSYNTSSDYRLKQNVNPLTGALTRVSNLAPKRFNWINKPSTTVDGFLAHEVSPVIPEAVVGSKDEVDSKGKPVYQGLDQSKLTPLLTAAVQELKTKVEALEARVTTLEG